MGETVVDRQALAAEIRRLEAWPQALARRVQGIAWMLWGVILAGTFVTYDYLGLAHQAYGGTMWPFAVAWIPWTVFGAVATWTLWKANGLVADVVRTARRMALAFVLFASLVFLLFVGYHFSGLWRGSPFVASAMMLVLMGLAAVVVGIVRLGTADVNDRFLWIIGGVALIAVGVVGTLLVADERAALQLFAWLGPLVTACVYFGNGLYLSLRG